MIRNKIYIALIIFLCVALISLGAFCFVNAKAYKKSAEKNQKALDSANATISEYSAQNSADASTISDLESKNSALQSDYDQKVKENSELAAQLAAKKAAAAAAAKGNNVTQPTGTAGVCYLTFDDGPSENTLSILDTLAKYNAKATFFVIGASSTQYISKIAAAGHTVGLHSKTHNYATIYKSTDAYFNDLQAISDIVESQTGIKSKVVRFPGGGSNTVSKKYCPGIMSNLSKLLPEKGYAYFDWNVSSGDASGDNVPASTLVNNVLNAAKGKNSLCVLMHDSAAKKTTAQALPEIMEGLSKMGFRFEALTPSCAGYHHPIAN